jgi:hypothetical protein
MVPSDICGVCNTTAELYKHSTAAADSMQATGVCNLTQGSTLPAAAGRLHLVAKRILDLFAGPCRHALKSATGTNMSRGLWMLCTGGAS